jgi:hypothetical protein
MAPLQGIHTRASSHLVPVEARGSHQGRTRGRSDSGGTEPGFMDVPEIHHTRRGDFASAEAASASLLQASRRATRSMSAVSGPPCS